MPAPSPIAVACRFNELLRTDDPTGTVYANGGATLMWLDFPKQKSSPMPEGLRHWLLGN